MARFKEPTKAEETAWKEWVKERPENVRAVAERFDPWSLYWLGRNRVFLRSFGEADDGTVTLTVAVSGAFNTVIFERSVFGIDPDSLRAADLPGPNELLGALLDDAMVDENIDAIRAAIGR